MGYNEWRHERRVLRCASQPSAGRRVAFGRRIRFGSRRLAPRFSYRAKQAGSTEARSRTVVQTAGNIASRLRGFASSVPSASTFGSSPAARERLVWPGPPKCGQLWPSSGCEPERSASPQFRAILESLEPAGLALAGARRTGYRMSLRTRTLLCPKGRTVLKPSRSNMLREPNHVATARP